MADTKKTAKKPPAKKSPVVTSKDIPRGGYTTRDIKPPVRR